MAATPEGIEHLERLPRRLVTLYLPLAVMLFVLLFPFYWMGTTSFKPDEELYDYAHFNPFWVAHPTLQHVRKLFFETSYPSWLVNTMIVSVAATAFSLTAASSPPTRSSACVSPGPVMSASLSSSPISSRRASCSSRWRRSSSSSGCSIRFGR